MAELNDVERLVCWMIVRDGVKALVVPPWSRRSRAAESCDTFILLIASSLMMSCEM